MVSVDGKLKPRTLADLGASDLTETSALCASVGAQPGSTSIFGGWTIARVIAAAGAVVQDTTRVTVTTPLESVTLLPADFNPDFPSDFFEPGAAAAIKFQSATNSTWRFFRPVREKPCADANGPDLLTGFSTAPIAIDIITGTRVLYVSADAEPGVASLGSPVGLTSSVFGAQPTGVGFSTTWSFDDGTGTATGADVTHVFSRVGTFTATATVVGSDGSGGVSPPVTITVGSAPGTPGNGATATTHPPQGVATSGPTSGVVIPGATALSGVGAATAGPSTGASASPGAPGRTTTATPRGSPAVVSGLLLAGDGSRPGARARLLAAGPHGTATSRFHLTTGESVGGLTAALLLGGGAMELRLGSNGAAAVRRTRRSRTAKGRHSP